MRRHVISVGILGVVLVALSCSDQTSLPTTTDVASAAGLEAARVSTPAQTGRSFVAPLRGAAEVPPVPTDAVGSAGFQIRLGGNAIEFLLLIGRLDNLSQAHIHLGGPGVNGPVVVWLYPPAPPPQPIPGEFNGVLSEGLITAANLVGPLEGQPLSALIDEIRAGNTYVNVHTAQFPGGEIRGQLSPITIID